MSQIPTVGIVRHQQFLPSETFIVNQAGALRTFRPLYVARDPVPERPGVESVSVAQFGRSAVLTYKLTRRSEALRQALAQRQVALLHAHFGVEGAYAVDTATALRIPLVTTLHGFDVTISKTQMLASKKPSWINYVMRREQLFRQGAVFICVSEHIRRRALRWGYPADRLVVLPIGIDTDRIRPVPPSGQPRILHVARLVEVKGTAYLLRAFAQVLRDIPDAELVIVGTGPLDESLKALTAELGVAGSVRFLGTQPYAETLRWMTQSRLLCLPSITAHNGAEEGLGMVLVEAAATGLPLVGTAHGGIPEVVSDGVNGFLVGERDVDALADRLLRLLADPGLSERFGSAGRAIVTERFDLRRQTDDLEALYRSLM